MYTLDPTSCEPVGMIVLVHIVHPIFFSFFEDMSPFMRPSTLKPIEFFRFQFYCQ